MEAVTSIVVLVAVAIRLSGVNSDETENSCPPGFVPNNGSCVCGDWPDGMIVCDEESQQASIRIGYCMTYDQDRGVTVGSCPQGYIRKKSTINSTTLYLQM